MANLKVSIVIMPTTGNRTPVPATGKLTDPQGTFCLRWYSGGKKKYKKVEGTYQDAETARLRKMRELDATSRGYLLPSAPGEGTQLHKLTNTLDHYLSVLSRPDADNEFKPEKSLTSSESEVTAFINWCPKKHVEEIDRDVLLAFRQHLYSEGYQRDTVRNKMGIVVSFLKHNELVPYKRILNKSDWPNRKDTVPDPYSEQEVFGMLSYASPDEQLLIRFFIATGMREGEVSVAERRDIVDNYIQVHRKKPQYGWRAKNKSAVRNIVLDEEFIEELLARPEGLLFPRADGERNQHIIRIIMRLAKLAGVTPTSAKASHPEAVKDDWCHRMRDCWFTHAVEDAYGAAALRDICTQGGHKDGKTLDAYVSKRDNKNPEARARAKKANRFANPKFKSNKVVSIAS